MNFELLAAVLLGNGLTVMFIYGAIRFTQDEKRGSWSWYHWGCIAFPLVMFLISLYLTAPPPPFLDVIVSRQ